MLRAYTTRQAQPSAAQACSSAMASTTNVPRVHVDDGKGGRAWCAHGAEKLFLPCARSCWRLAGAMHTTRLAAAAAVAVAASEVSPARPSRCMRRAAACRQAGGCSASTELRGSAAERTATCSSGSQRTRHLRQGRGNGSFAYSVPSTYGLA